MLIKHSSGVIQTAGHTSLKFRGECACTLILFKAIRLDENKERVIPWVLQTLKVSERRDKGAREVKSSQFNKKKYHVVSQKPSEEILSRESNQLCQLLLLNKVKD